MTTIITIPDGRLCADVRLNEVGTGKVANIRIASNFRVKDGDEWVSEALFMDVEIWKGSEAVAQHFAKGSPIAVWGELQERKWTDPNTGLERTSLTIKNAGWAFPPKPAEDQQAQAAPPQQQGYQQPQYQPPAQQAPPQQPQYQQPPVAPQYTQPPMQQGAPQATAFAGDNDIPF